MSKCKMLDRLRRVAKHSIEGFEVPNITSHVVLYMRGLETPTIERGKSIGEV